MEGKKKGSGASVCLVCLVREKYGCAEEPLTGGGTAASQTQEKKTERGPAEGRKPDVFSGSDYS